MTNRIRKNREKINQTQGKYQWIAGALIVYYYFSVLKFLPCLFFKLTLSPLQYSLLILTSWMLCEFIKQLNLIDFLLFCRQSVSISPSNLTTHIGPFLGHANYTVTVIARTKFPGLPTVKNITTQESSKLSTKITFFDIAMMNWQTNTDIMR